VVLDELIARRVDGIIWAVPEIGENRSWLRLNELVQLPPIVLLSMETRPGFSIVAVDNRAGARIAVEHLLEQGRRRIGIITGPLTWWEARERLAGWHEALEEAGLAQPPGAIGKGDWSAASGQRAMESLLTDAPKVDAVFASNDQMALGALGVLDRAGKHVPEDIALVGFDNIPEAEFFIPSLTTIYQQLTEIGRAAVQELHAQIDARRREETKAGAAVQLTPTLIVRDSSVTS
jgi:LacI family transcriptional regulator